MEIFSRCYMIAGTHNTFLDIFEQIILYEIPKHSIRALRVFIKYLLNIIYSFRKQQILLNDLLNINKIHVGTQ